MRVKKLLKILKKTDKNLDVRIVLIGGDDPKYYDNISIKKVLEFNCIEISIKEKRV